MSWLSRSRPGGSQVALAGEDKQNWERGAPSPALSLHVASLQRCYAGKSFELRPRRAKAPALPFFWPPRLTANGLLRQSGSRSFSRRANIGSTPPPNLRSITILLATRIILFCNSIFLIHNPAQYVTPRQSCS